ncbi:hypothetical protein OIU78_017370 [Salix suchowensis]|nr:hypothetical protein OIU78_017370 [Salix suchowensis]
MSHQKLMGGVVDFDQVIIAGDQTEAAERLACFDDGDQQQLEKVSRRKKKKKGGKMNTRRFSDEQVRSLESVFESETKAGAKKEDAASQRTWAGASSGCYMVSEQKS